MQNTTGMPHFKKKVQKSVLLDDAVNCYTSAASMVDE
jgi:hypothetical protein